MARRRDSQGSRRRARGPMCDEQPLPPNPKGPRRAARPASRPRRRPKRCGLGPPPLAMVQRASGAVPGPASTLGASPGIPPRRRARVALLLAARGNRLASTWQTVPRPSRVNSSQAGPRGPARFRHATVSRCQLARLARPTTPMGLLAALLRRPAMGRTSATPQRLSNPAPTPGRKLSGSAARLPHRR